MISAADIAYVCTRNRLAAFNAVRTEFEKSGLSQKDLAKKLGSKDAGRLSRLLGAPGNWTLDTAAMLLWAMTGARIPYAPLDYPLEKAPRNDTRPPFVEQQWRFDSGSSAKEASIVRRKLPAVELSLP